MEEKKKILARSELFKTLPPEGLDFAAARAVVITVKEGDPLIVETRPAPGIFVLAEGTVDYIKRVDEKNGLVVCRWSQGDTVGLDAVMDAKPYFVTALATSPVKALHVTTADFQALCDAATVYEHRLYTQALLIQSTRLRQITQCLRDFLAKIIK